MTKNIFFPNFNPLLKKKLQTYAVREKFNQRVFGVCVCVSVRFFFFFFFFCLNQNAIFINEGKKKKKWTFFFRILHMRRALCVSLTTEIIEENKTTKRQRMRERERKIQKARVRERERDRKREWERERRLTHTRKDLKKKKTEIKKNIFFFFTKNGSKYKQVSNSFKSNKNKIKWKPNEKKNI